MQSIKVPARKGGRAQTLEDSQHALAFSREDWEMNTTLGMYFLSGGKLWTCTTVLKVSQRMNHTNERPHLWEITGRFCKNTLFLWNLENKSRYPTKDDHLDSCNRINKNWQDLSLPHRPHLTKVRCQSGQCRMKKPLLFKCHFLWCY